METPNHNAFILISLYVLWDILHAFLPGEADLQDGLNMNFSGHEFFVRTIWGRFSKKSLIFRSKFATPLVFPCECDTPEFIGSKGRRVFKCLIH